MNPVNKGYIAVQWEVLSKHLSGILRPRKAEPETVVPAE